MNDHPHTHPFEILLDGNLAPTDIPLDWTPTQAETAVTILSQIEEQIWNVYGDDIVRLLKTDPVDCSDFDTQNDTLEDDDIPF